jgi:hypothetical protein
MLGEIDCIVSESASTNQFIFQFIEYTMIANSSKGSTVVIANESE